MGRPPALATARGAARCRVIGTAAAAFLGLAGPDIDAQTRSYSMSGEVTSVPRCVEDDVAPGDPWRLVLRVDPALTAPEVDETETAADPDDMAVDEGEAPPDERVRPADGNHAAPGAAEPAAEPVPVVVRTARYLAQSFEWTIGDWSGTADGDTRVFVSDDHLGQDSVTWQALDYSADFEPPTIGVTAIRGIQAGLIDRSATVFGSTDLPDRIERERFTGDGFFEVFFQTKCGVFRSYPIAGTVGTVQVIWARDSEAGGEAPDAPGQAVASQPAAAATPPGDSRLSPQ